MLKKVGFLLSRTNFLYSFIPLAQYLSKLKYEITFFVPSILDNKNNSLSHHSNKILVDELLKSYCYNLNMNSAKQKDYNIDFLFTIEGHGLEEELPYHVIYIQNYNDFGRWANKDSAWIYKLKHTAWFINSFYENEAKNLYNPSNTFSSVLPGYWAYEDKTKNEIKAKYGIHYNDNVATCFLPRPDSVDMSHTFKRDITWNTSNDPEKDLVHAIQFAKKLTDDNYKILFKQRQKNRNYQLCTLKNYIEDISIYPFTSLDISYMSDLCYGYMSMSIMDSATFGTPYINFEKDCYPEELHRVIAQWYNDEGIIGINLSRALSEIQVPDREFDLRSTSISLKEKISDSKNQLCRFIKENI